MIRTIAGVLDRRGRPGPGDLERLRRATGGEPAVSGALALAWSGPPAARAGDAIAVADGTLDVVPGAEATESGVLDAWQRDRETILPALRGDFALAVWDGRRGLLARDHMGGRGWVLHDDGGRLRFATDAAPLLELLPATPPPDTAAVAHWIEISGMPGARSLLAGVLRLPGGSWVALDPARPAEPSRYWRLRPQPLRPGDVDDHAAALRAALAVAVERRSRAGSVTGVMLSGGLDSAAVGGIAAESPARERRPRSAYSAVFPGHPTVDESALIARLCDAYGLRSVRAVVRGGSVLAGAVPYLERWRLPPVSPNLFFWRPLLEQAHADGTRVLLDGEGGDELFGLSPYLVADLLRRGRPRQAIATIRSVPGAGGNPSPAAIRRWLKLYGLRGLMPPAAHGVSRRLRGPRAYTSPWLRAPVARAFLETADGAAFKRHGHPRWWGHLVEVVVHGMGPALVYDHVRRRAAMAGLEARHPLVDVDVVELVLRLPPETAYHPQISRPLIRRAMGGIVPDEVRKRPTKSSFDAVFHEALAGPDLPAVRTLLGDPGARVGEFVDAAAMRAALVDPGPPQDAVQRQEWALRAWRLLTLECWLRGLEDPAAPRRALVSAGAPEGLVEVVGPDSSKFG